MYQFKPIHNAGQQVIDTSTIATDNEPPHAYSTLKKAILQDLFDAQSMA